MQKNISGMKMTRLFAVVGKNSSKGEGGNFK